MGTTTSETVQGIARRARRTIGLATLVSSVALLVAAFVASPAAAVLIHDFNFGSAGSAGGKLNNPAGIGINYTTGDVYVAEVDNNRISQFTEAGVFIRTWGEGVNATSGGDVCPRASSPGDDCQAGQSGFGPGGFSGPAAVEIDNSCALHDPPLTGADCTNFNPAAGSVYVQDTGNRRIQRFSADGQFVLMWGKGVNQTSGGDVCPRPSSPGDTCQTGAGTSEPVGFNDGPHTGGGWAAGETTGRIAVDGAGNIYANSGYDPPFAPDLRDARVVKFSPTGAVLGQAREKTGNETSVFSAPFELAADTAGNVYVNNGETQVKKLAPSDFTPSGLINSLDPAFPHYGTLLSEVAIDPSNQYLFALDPSFRSPCPVVSSGDLTHIVEYHPGGEVVDCSPPTTPGFDGDGSEMTSMAISLTHKLYMSVGDEIRVFHTPVASAPAIDSEAATNVTSNSARLNARVAANLAPTTYRVEYGTSPCSDLPNPCVSTPELAAGASFFPKDHEFQLNGIAPNTTYYYRFVATNSEGSDTGPDRRFTTFSVPIFDPSCPNNLARQQTGAASLLDCRAYELVSAENQGGYNVESNLVPAQTPFAGFPEADGKALYAMHSGGVPGTGKPTNRGPDPYVATRDAASQRWNTAYVGIPADAPSLAPFSSTLADGDSRLETFAFWGSEVCNPCFPDGSAGIPIRTPNGGIAQGMVGSMPVALPEPSGGVDKHLSDDGSHFLFASEQQFEPEGNPDDGNVTIYDRSLDLDRTQVVSTMPDGSTIANGSDVRALDISENGSRIVIGNLVSTDPEGNEYHDLYMHEGNSPNSIEIVSGGSGGLYVGMTSDGSQVFFTSRDNLADDSDSSADLFRASIAGGVATIERVSSGESGSGNTDACDPAANSYNVSDWNSIPGGPTDCSVLAIGGGGGIAKQNGRVYFLSPEKLDGSGVEGAPNLYRAGLGEHPRFVTTLESSANSALLPPPTEYLGSFTRPLGAAIGREDGSTYVYDPGNTTPGALGGPPDAYVQKFDSSGNPDSGFSGDSKLDGFYADGSGLLGSFFLGSPVPFPTQVAVDNNPSSDSYGDLYVPDHGSGFLDSGRVHKYSSSGSLEYSMFTGDFPSGVAVDPVNGNVYASTLMSSSVFVFDDSGAPAAPTTFSVSGNPRGLAVDSNSRVYVANGSSTRIYDGATGAPLGILDPGPSYGVAVDPGVLSDPADDRIYVDQGNQLVVYDSVGTQVGGPIGSGLFSESVSLAADSGKLVVSNPGGGNVVIIDPKTPKSRSYDSPLVIDSIRTAGVRRTDQFQTTASGDHAVLASTLSLGEDGYDSAGKYEVFRYDALVEQVTCASCNPTGLAPASDATLASNGLSITDDGRVFFNTREALTLRDTNDQRDVYEWAPQQPHSVGACHESGGCVELISTGKDRSDSGLLSVTADGTDAFFFTRETLASNDDNGNLVKLYTAREEGGFFVIPPPPDCKASDECHGPGTEAAAPPALGTLKGVGGNLPPTCKRKFVKRRGRCVRRRGNRSRKHRNRHHPTRRHG